MMEYLVENADEAIEQGVEIEAEDTPATSVFRGYNTIESWVEADLMDVLEMAISEKTDDECKERLSNLTDFFEICDNNWIHDLVNCLPTGQKPQESEFGHLFSLRLSKSFGDMTAADCLETNLSGFHSCREDPSSYCFNNNNYNSNNSNKNVFKNFNNCNSARRSSDDLMMFNENLISNLSSNHLENLELSKSPEVSMQELNSRIRCISMGEFQRVTTNQARSPPQPRSSRCRSPPTPPPLPDLSPPPPTTFHRASKNHIGHKNINTNNTTNKHVNNMYDKAIKQNSKCKDAVFERPYKVDIPDNRVPAYHRGLPTIRRSGVKVRKALTEMEEFTKELVANKNWTNVVVSGIDPTELYFRHQYHAGNQSLTSLLGDDKWNPAEKNRKSQKRHYSKFDFLQNSNSSAKDYNVEKSRKVLDRMEKAWDRIGEWDWISNKPRRYYLNRNHHHHSPSGSDNERIIADDDDNFAGDEQDESSIEAPVCSKGSCRRGKRENVEETREDLENESSVTGTTAASSEHLFPKKSNLVSSKSTKSSDPSFHIQQDISSESTPYDNVTSDQTLELIASRQATYSDPVSSHHHSATPLEHLISRSQRHDFREGDLLPAQSDVFQENVLSSKLDIASGALLIGKYSQKKQFPMDDVTYNQGSRRVIQFLHSLWLEQVTCDVTVVANGGSVMAHQVILAAWSPTLASLFKQHHAESERSDDPVTINMTDYPRDVVADVVNFLYTTDIRLELANVGAVVAVSRELDIMTLVNVCGDFLIKTCEPEAVLLHYSVAANNDLKYAQEGLSKVIASSIVEVSDHKYFTYLPFDRFHGLLAHPRMCGREIDIFQTIVKWVDFNRIERLRYSKDLLKLIRFQHMCMNDLAQKVEFASWIFVEKETRDLLLDSYKFHAMLSSGVNPPGNFRLDKPRCASYNKKKPLMASLNEFRNDYSEKMQACLASQETGQRPENWDKMEIMKRNSKNFHEFYGPSIVDPNISEQVISRGWTNEDMSKINLFSQFASNDRTTRSNNQTSAHITGSFPSSSSQGLFRQQKVDSAGYLPLPVYKENSGSGFNNFPTMRLDQTVSHSQQSSDQPLQQSRSDQYGRSTPPTEVPSSQRGSTAQRLSSLEINLRNLKKSLPRHAPVSSKDQSVSKGSREIDPRQAVFVEGNTRPRY